MSTLPIPQVSSSRRGFPLRAGILFAAIAGSLAAQSTPPNNFLVHNLVSDLPNIADHQDTKLVNPWGNGFSSASPFWIGDNGSGYSTVYDGTGTPNTARIVTIPQAGGAGTTGPVTGVISNAFTANTAAFNVSATGVAAKPSSFIFCSLDGVISGWSSSVTAGAAQIMVDNSKNNAVYTGCAQGGTSTAPYVYLANFYSGTVDVMDGTNTLNPAAFGKGFVNAGVPAGYAPYNIQNINGTLFVAYAKQNSAKNASVPGAGSGYVAMFTQAGVLIGNLISGGALNAPWGFAIAPATFGPFGGALLVGNFGDGTINAFNATTGALLGTLDASGTPISIAGLWSINFGNGASNTDTGTLYITAGIGGGPNNGAVQTHGLLASIQAVPSFTTAGIINGASTLVGPIAPNTWAAVKGAGLSAMMGNWVVTGSTLPTTTNGVTVSVNGELAAVSYVSPTQVNFLVPADISPGTAQIQVTNNGLASANVTATVAQFAPAFFTNYTDTSGNKYIAATHANGSYLGVPASITGITLTAAVPGETAVLYGTGFGANLSGSTQLAVKPTIVIDGVAANVTFAGNIGAGLDQFNVVIPATVSTGQNVLVVGLIGNFETPAGVFIPMQ